jgi:hypothetical protein
MRRHKRIQQIPPCGLNVFASSGHVVRITVFQSLVKPNLKVFATTFPIAGKAAQIDEVLDLASTALAGDVVAQNVVIDFNAHRVW